MRSVSNAVSRSERVPTFVRPAVPRCSPMLTSRPQPKTGPTSHRQRIRRTCFRQRSQSQSQSLRGRQPICPRCGGQPEIPGHRRPIRPLRESRRQIPRPQIQPLQLRTGRRGDRAGYGSTRLLARSGSQSSSASSPSRPPVRRTRVPRLPRLTQQPQRQLSAPPIRRLRRDHRLALRAQDLRVRPTAALTNLVTATPSSSLRQ
jgi:hypothetical protein